MFSSPSSGPGRVLTGTGSLSHAGLLQTGPAGYMALTCRHGFPRAWIGRYSLGLPFTHGFIFPELPEKPANLPHLKTCWARSVFYWYDYLATIFVPSLETTDQILSYELML